MKIKLFTPINPTGIGTHAQHLLWGLDNEIVCVNTEVKLQVCPTGTVRYSASKTIRLHVGELLMRGTKFEDPDVNIVLNSPQKCNEWLEENRRFTKGKTVAYTVFELIPRTVDTVESLAYRKQLGDLDKFDEVWVPSEWARAQLITNYGFSCEKVKVAPEGAASYGPITSPKKLHEGLVFGNVGKFEVRKGHHALLDTMAGIQAPTTLLLWCHNFWAPLAAADYLKSRDWFTEDGEVFMKNEATVRLMPHVKWQEDMIKEWEQVDVMVFPTFTEGWGLPIAESIAAGIPTLTTGATGSNPFSHPYLLRNRHCRIPIDSAFGPCLAYDRPFFNGQGSWHTVEPISLARCIARVIEHPQQYLRKDFVDEAEQIRKNYSWEQSARHVLNLCANLYSSVPA